MHIALFIALIVAVFAGAKYLGVSSVYASAAAGFLTSAQWVFSAPRTPERFVELGLFWLVAAHLVAFWGALVFLVILIWIGLTID